MYLLFLDNYGIINNLNYITINVDINIRMENRESIYDIIVEGFEYVIE